MGLLPAKFLTVLVLVTLLSFSSGLETEGGPKKRPPKASPSPSPSPLPPSLPPGLGNFDYYVLAVQWTISYCSETDANGRYVNYCSNHKYSEFPLHFTIHGLWPANNDNSPPVQKKEEFDENKITGSSVYNQLIQEWPNAKYIAHALQTERDMEFWKYQWEKHGTATILSQEDYFQLAVDLHRYVKRYLAQYARGSTININYLKQRFHTLGGMPAVICNFSGNREQLFELRFNVTRSNTFVNHQQFGRGCSHTVYLP